MLTSIQLYLHSIFYTPFYSPSPIIIFPDSSFPLIPFIVMATIPPPRPPTTLNDLCREYKFVTANHAAWQKQYETYKTIKKEYNELVDKSQSRFACSSSSNCLSPVSFLYQ